MKILWKFVNFSRNRANFRVLRTKSPDLLWALINRGASIFVNIFADLTRKNSHEH